MKPDPLNRTNRPHPIGRRTVLTALAEWWADEVTSGVDYDDVIGRVRADAGWSAHFAVMTVLSAGIAILGLLLDSPAVVIGAMLISPLMAPIIGAGFGLATFDVSAIRRALWALVGGTLLALAFCAAMVSLSPIQTVTSEIASRTRPNLFDLLVALLAGLAGTYAVIRGRHGAIVGVAIATALMPPLAVMGFGLATRNWSVLSGSSFLFFTNLMTIAAAAAALARLYGFATGLSPHQTHLQIVLLTGSLIVLAVPLGLALKKIAWEALATSEAKSAVAGSFGPGARVSDLRVHFDSQPIEIDATVLTPAYRKSAEQLAESKLEDDLGTRVSVSIDQVRTSDGDSAALDVNKTDSTAVAGTAERIAQELALVSGASPDRVLIDPANKTAQVRATELPNADLSTYRELERRVAAAEPGWTIHVIPPPLPLPAIDDPETRNSAIQTAIWAAQRLALPIELKGQRADADSIEQQLKGAGIAVSRSPGGRLSLHWQMPDSETRRDRS